jgi:hypothetical protein
MPQASHDRVIPLVNSVPAMPQASHDQAMPLVVNSNATTIQLNIKADHDQRLPTVKVRDKVRVRDRVREAQANRHPHNVLVDTRPSAPAVERTVQHHSKAILSISAPAVADVRAVLQQQAALVRRDDLPVAETAPVAAPVVQHKKQANDDQHQLSKRNQRVPFLFQHRSW